MITLYGIKNCDTVKRARKWLESRDIEYCFHDFREDGLDAGLLDRLESRLGWSNMLNRRSTSWRQIPDSEKSDLDTRTAKALMLAHPTLIKRPVLENQQTLLIGFSSDEYAQFL